jgi:polar amino acid transport system substrate-binding protein
MEPKGGGGTVLEEEARNPTRDESKTEKETVMKKFVSLFVIGIFVLATAGMTFAAESAIDQIVKRGTIKVGMDTFVPWAMKDKTGKLIGFEIDVANRLAADSKWKVEFVPTQWSGIIPALLTGKFDVIIGGMTITPERNQKINFSIPYDYASQMMMGNKKVAGAFKTTEDFNKPDVAIAARLGSTAAIAAKKYMPKAQLRLFDNEAQAVQELLNGKVAGMVASAPLPAFTAIKYPDTIFVLSQELVKESIGFGLRKGDFDSMNYFNNWILMATNDGFLQERHNYWFMTNDWRNMVE